MSDTEPFKVFVTCPVCTEAWWVEVEKTQDYAMIPLTHWSSLDISLVAVPQSVLDHMGAHRVDGSLAKAFREHAEFLLSHAELADAEGGEVFAKAVRATREVGGVSNG